MLKKCSKCQKSFECKESNACWCNKIEHVCITNDKIDYFCEKCLLRKINKLRAYPKIILL